MVSTMYTYNKACPAAHFKLGDGCRHIHPTDALYKTELTSPAAAPGTPPGALRGLGRKETQDRGVAVGV